MSDGRRGRGIAAAGGDARSPSSGFPRHIHPTFVAEGRCSRRAPRGYRTTSGRRVRRCRACAGFSAPISCSASCPSAAWVVRGARGTARRDLRVCPSLPPRTCHETGARRSDRRNGPRPNVSVRFESATARAHKRDRQTSALKTISLRYVPTRSIAHLGIGLHTSANVGRLASRAAGDPGGRRSDSSPTVSILDSPLFNRRPPLDRQLAPHQPDEIPHRRVDPQVQVPAHHRAVQRAPERPGVRPRSPHPPHALAAKRVPARQRHRRTRLALAAEIPQAHRASKIVAEPATNAVQGCSGGGSGAFILTDTRPRRVVWRQGRQRG